MARLWSSGFELQSVTNDVEFGVTNSPTIDTTTKRSGLASLRVNPSATTAFINQSFVVLGAAQEVHWYFRFYLRIASATDALDSIWVIRQGTSALVSLRMNADRTLELWNDDDAAQVGVDSSALDTDTWYRIELDMTVGTTQDVTALTGYIDGAQFATGTFNANATDGTWLMRLGACTATTCDLYFDDVAINDGTGTVQNGLPGAGSIVHMQPDGAGDNNDASAGTFADVDEVTPDDATTIATLDADNDILDVAMESSSNAGIGSGDTVTLVQVGIREAALTAAQESWVLRIKSASGGTTTESATITHNDTTYRTNGDTTFFGYQLTSYVDPTTTAAWTPTGTNSLDNMQIGVRAVDATPDILVSTLWALVEFVPAEGVSTLSVNVSDSITVAESTQVRETSFINKSDSIAVAESISVKEVNLVNVSDTIGTTESTQALLVSNVPVSDAISVAESLTAFLPTLYITASDTIAVTESLEARELSLVNVSDGIAVTEPVAATLVINTAIEDSISVAESLSILQPFLAVTVSDSGSLSEALEMFIPFFTPVISDAISVSENTQLVVTPRFVSVSDTISVTESVEAEVEDTNISVSVSDSIGVTEAVTLFSPTYNVAVSESISVAESYAVEKPAIPSIDLGVALNTHTVSVGLQPTPQVVVALPTSNIGASLDDYAINVELFSPALTVTLNSYTIPIEMKTYSILVDLES